MQSVARETQLSTAVLLSTVIVTVSAQHSLTSANSYALQALTLVF